MADIVDPFKKSSVSTDIIDPFANPTKEEKELGLSKQFYDDTWIGELGEGIVSGGIKAVEGVAQTAALVPDLLTGSEYGDSIANASKSVRDAMGLDPEGFLGKGSEIVTQFVVPGVAGAKAAGKLGSYLRGGKEVSRTRRVAEEIAGGAVADAAVATEDLETIGDWFDNPVTSTTDLVGLSGREKALARLGNKFKVGVEGGLFGAGIQGAMVGTGKTLSQVAKVPGVKEGLIASKQGLDKVGANIDNLLYKRMMEDPNGAQELTKFKRGMADLISFVRYRGYLPERVANKRLKLEGVIRSDVQKADRNLTELEDEMKIYVSNLPKGSELTEKDLLTKVEEFLVEPNKEKKALKLKELPTGAMRNSAIKMRTHVDELSTNIMGSNFLREYDITLPSGDTLKSTIDKNLNSYLRRTYKIHKDKSYMPTQQQLDVAKDYMKGSKKNVEYELTKGFREGQIGDDFLKSNNLTKFTDDTGTSIKIGKAGITEESATKSRDLFLLRNRIRNSVSEQGGKVAKDKLKTNMFASRTVESKELRQLLGEVSDPREAYLGTIADLAQFSAIDDYYGTITKLAAEDSGIGKLFVKPTGDLTQEAELKNRGFVKLGGEEVVGKDSESILKKKDWGTLEGYYVPKQVYNNLTNTIMAQGNFGTEALRQAYSLFRRGKGISQYSKTVLSPVTQVRNFLTASMFAMANGNLFSTSTKSSFADSIRAVTANVRNKGSDEVFNTLERAQRLGIVGTNAELREIQDLLNKTVGVSGATAETGTTSAGREMLGGETISNLVKKSGPTAEKLAKPFARLGKVNKFAEQLYQGSDDVWKLTSWLVEQDKLKAALKTTDINKAIKYLKGTDDSFDLQNVINRTKETGNLDELIEYRSAQIVSDTVPNYNKGASDAIRWARNLPLGNFITFPAEIYRTGFNIVKQSLDDIASDIPEIQARGRGRLTSFITTTAILPTSIPLFGSAISGVSQEEMQAYKRSFAPEWEKGAVLMPISKDEDGTINYINFSTSNPYDTLYRFANRALNEADTAMKDGKSPPSIVGNAMWQAVAETFQPFTDPSIITSSLTDISIRGGKQATGAEVWNPADSAGTKAYKGFMHIVDSVLPGLVPVNISSGTVEPSRFLRGVLGGTPLVDSKNKIGREYEFKTEILRQISGVSPLEFDPKKGLEWQAYGFSQAQTNSKRIFNRVADDYNASSRDLLNAYVEANKAKYRTDKQYSRMIEDLKSMGMKDTEIRKILKKNQIGGAKEILRGKFSPFKVTPKNMKEMRDAGIFDRFPRQEINAVRDQLRNIPLNPEEPRPDFSPPRENTTPVPNIVNPFSNPTIIPSAPNVNTTPVPNIVDPFSNLNFQTNASRPVDPALVGNDPATQEIANRLR